MRYFLPTQFCAKVKASTHQAWRQIYQNLIGNPKAGVSHDGPFRVDQANHFHGGRIGRGTILEPLFENRRKACPRWRPMSVRPELLPREVDLVTGK